MGYSDSSVHWTVVFTWAKAETVKNRLDLKIDSIHTAKESKQEKGSKHFHVTKNGLKKLHLTARKETIP